MRDPQLTLHLAHNVLCATTLDLAANAFAPLCVEDPEAAGALAEFLVKVLPHTSDLWEDVFQQAMAQSHPQPSTWGDADTADTAASVDQFLRGGAHAAES